MPKLTTNSTSTTNPADSTGANPTDVNTTVPMVATATETTEMVPVTVTARLQQGIVFDLRFGTAFDGLLASTIRDQAKAVHYQETGRIVTGSMLDGGTRIKTPATVELPLARCQNAADDDWHWLATTGYPLGWDGELVAGDPDVHYLHTRLREHVAEQTVLKMPTTIDASSGRFRNYRLPVPVTVAYAVAWRAVGDPDKLRELTSAITSIGGRRNSGEGAVLSWDVTVDEAGDWNQFGHLHPDGTLGRPTPTSCASKLPDTTFNPARTGMAGIRPPYFHAATQRHVLLPEPFHHRR